MISVALDYYRRVRTRTLIRVDTTANSTFGILTGEAVAEHFCVNGGATCARMLELLEDEQCGALCDHEAVAANVEGPRGRLWPVVEFGAQSADLREARRYSRAETVSLCAAGQHHVCVAVPHEAERVADAVYSARARRGHTSVRALSNRISSFNGI